MNPDNFDHIDPIDDGTTGCLVPGCLLLGLAGLLLLAGMVLR